MDKDRKEDGTFAKGHKVSGRGGDTNRVRLMAFKKAALKSVSTDEAAEFFRKCFTEAKNGDKFYAKLMLAYLFGKPDQAVTIEASVEAGVDLSGISDDQLRRICERSLERAGETPPD